MLQEDQLCRLSKVNVQQLHPALPGVCSEVCAWGGVSCTQVGCEVHVEWLRTTDHC